MDIIMSGKNLTKQFGGLIAVNDVSFELKKHEILGLIGPNGAGKTTLFNLISGTLPMTFGELFYKGRKIKKPVSHKMCALGIGRTYQICKPFGALTVRENVMVGTYIRYNRTDEARKKADEALKRVDLYHRADMRGDQLTLPELKRMEVARAIATEPDVLLLDEVIAGLNATEVENIMKLIRKIRDQGITIIMIEHVMQAVMNLSDRIIVINEGKKIAEGTPKDISKNPLVIECYLGKGNSVC